jgi:TatD DNase family protein
MMGVKLIDIGANLAHDSFDADRDSVIARAAEAGVTRIVLTGSSDRSNRAALALAHSMPGRLFATAGVHPHHASDYSDEVDCAIRTLTEDRACVAVGECGLDYFRNFSPRDAQLRAFERQLAIAADTGLPVFLHQRDAHEEFVQTLESRLAGISRAVAHCFTGDEVELNRYLDMGLFIGITGWICDERRGAHLKDIVGLIPDDRLMLETDAPYLLPRSLTPKPSSRRNEPAYLREVLRVVAEARGETEAKVAAATTATAEAFFALPRD